MAGRRPKPDDQKNQTHNLSLDPEASRILRAVPNASAFVSALIRNSNATPADAGAVLDAVKSALEGSEAIVVQESESGMVVRVQDDFYQIRCTPDAVQVFDAHAEPIFTTPAAQASFVRAAIVGIAERNETTTKFRSLLFDIFPKERDTDFVRELVRLCTNPAKTVQDVNYYFL